MIGMINGHSVRRMMHKIIAGALAAHRDGRRFTPISPCRAGLRLATALFLGVVPTTATASPAQVQIAEWRAWDSFRQRFIQPDGRVVEHEADSRTTSEAQAYAMFFALVNNQPEWFARLLSWTETQLAGGDLATRLPGWLWGPAKASSIPGSGSPARLLDENSASDADLWLAYALLEAGRLWQVPRYHRLGESLLRQISHREVLRLPDGFMTLLPAPRGFRVGEHRWRINPSYFVPQQLSLFARIDPLGPWQRLETQLPQLLNACCISGYAPDWLTYHEATGWQADQGGQLTGSYDAIRVYLWAGMMDAQQPGRQTLLDALHGMRKQLQDRGAPAERIDVTTGRASDMSPPGFIAAIVPYLDALDERTLLASSLQRLRALEARDASGLYGHKQRYYDQVLVLFGLGYAEKRYRFSRCGELLPAWRSAPSAC